MRYLVAVAALTALLNAGITYLSAQTKPTFVGEGIISTGDFDSHPAFAPDGKTLYFVRSDPGFTHWTMLFSRSENGTWTRPEVAPFSGQYADADPFITADGSKFYFISNRPAPGKTAGDLDIWVMEKSSNGWGEPRNVGVPINSPGNEWFPTLSASGTLYFGSDREGGKGRTDLYRSRVANGSFSQPENLGDSINTKFNEFEPLIAPDENYLIFMAGGRQDSRGGFDLYISRNSNGAWTTPHNLGDEVNSAGNEYSPAFSPDRKHFFWTSTRSSFDKTPDKPLNELQLTEKLHAPGNGLGDIYMIDANILNNPSWR